MTYRLAEQKDMKECVSLLADTFSDYLYCTIYSPKGKNHLKFLEKAISIDFSVYFRRGFVLVAEENGKICASCFLTPPEFKPPRMIEYLLNGGLKLVFTGGIINVVGFNNLVEKVDMPCRKFGKKIPSWNLTVFGVKRDLKGQGIGSAMIKDFIIPFVKEHDGKNIILVTNAEYNVGFYQKNGFTLFEQCSFTFRKILMGSWYFKLSV